MAPSRAESIQDTSHTPCPLAPVTYLQVSSPLLLCLLPVLKFPRTQFQITFHLIALIYLISCICMSLNVLFLPKTLP